MVFLQDGFKDKTRLHEKVIFEYHKIPYKWTKLLWLALYTAS